MRLVFVRFLEEIEDAKKTFSNYSRDLNLDHNKTIINKTRIQAHFMAMQSL